MPWNLSGNQERYRVDTGNYNPSEVYAYNRLREDEEIPSLTGSRSGGRNALQIAGGARPNTPNPNTGDDMTDYLGETYDAALKKQIEGGFDTTGMADIQRAERNRKLMQVQEQSGMSARNPAALMYGQQLQQSQAAQLQNQQMEQSMMRLNLIRQAFGERKGYQDLDKLMQMYG